MATVVESIDVADVGVDAKVETTPRTPAADAEEGPLPTLLGGRSQRELQLGGLAAKELKEPTEPREPARSKEEAVDSDEEGAAEGGEEAGDAHDSEEEREALRRAAEKEAFWCAAVKALKERERHEKVQAFLKAHGFSHDVNESKGWPWKYTYPLHYAARKGDAQMVRLLLESKATRRQRDSDGRSARQLARREDHVGSHAEVIKALTRSKRHAKKKVVGAGAAPGAAEAKEPAVAPLADEAEAAAAPGAAPSAEAEAEAEAMAEEMGGADGAGGEEASQPEAAQLAAAASPEADAAAEAARVQRDGGDTRGDARDVAEAAEAADRSAAGSPPGI